MLGCISDDLGLIFGCILTPYVHFLFSWAMFVVRLPTNRGQDFYTYIGV